MAPQDDTANEPDGEVVEGRDASASSVSPSAPSVPRASRTTGPAPLASHSEPADGLEPRGTHDTPARMKELRRRSWQSVWAAAIGVIVVSIVMGLVLDHDLAWVGVALVAAGVAAAAEAATQGKSTAFREFVFAERPPFSATASLKAEHLLRLASSADPYYQEVIPVSGAHRVQLVVESRSEHPVTIRTIRPLVVGRRPPRKGEPGVAAGLLPDGQFEVLLDADPPRLQSTVSAAGNANAVLPVILHPGDEPLTLVLTPRTDSYETDWRLELDWTADDKEGTATVGLGNKPFRATAEAGW
jgi:hypothetical protein